MPSVLISGVYEVTRTVQVSEKLRGNDILPAEIKDQAIIHLDGIGGLRVKYTDNKSGLIIEELISPTFGYVSKSGSQIDRRLLDREHSMFQPLLLNAYTAKWVKLINEEMVNVEGGVIASFSNEKDDLLKILNISTLGETNYLLTIKGYEKNEPLFQIEFLVERLFEKAETVSLQSLGDTADRFIVDSRFPNSAGGESIIYPGSGLLLPDDLIVKFAKNPRLMKRYFLALKSPL